MPTFSEIQHEISNILSVADEDLTPEQRLLFDAYADELAEQEEDKIDGFVAFIRAQQARADYLKDEAKRLTIAARNTEAKLGRLKEHYRHIMQANGLKKVSGKVYSASIRATPIVLVEQEQLVPKDFWRIKTEQTIDKAAVRDALKAGTIVPGCSLGKSYSLQTA